MTMSLIMYDWPPVSEIVASACEVAELQGAWLFGQVSLLGVSFEVEVVVVLVPAALQ